VTRLAVLTPVEYHRYGKSTGPTSARAPAPEALIDFGQLDNAVRAVAHAITATNTGRTDDYLTTDLATYRIGRAVMQ
jgi:hypothetical protein